MGTTSAGSRYSHPSPSRYGRHLDKSLRISELEGIPRAKVVFPKDLRLKSSSQRTWRASAFLFPFSFLSDDGHFGDPQKSKRPRSSRAFLFPLYFQCSESDGINWRGFSQMSPPQFQIETAFGPGMGFIHALRLDLHPGCTERPGDFWRAAARNFLKITRLSGCGL